MPDSPWDDADIIDIYTRRQAIEDGVLVQLSGPGYQGDPWMPVIVAEAGFRYPVAMTATAFCSYVSPMEGDEEKLAPCQDIKGRLWDVLWMLKLAIRRGLGGEIVRFCLRVVPNVPAVIRRLKRLVAWIRAVGRATIGETANSATKAWSLPLWRRYFGTETVVEDITARPFGHGGSDYPFRYDFQAALPTVGR